MIGKQVILKSRLPIDDAIVKITDGMGGLFSEKIMIGNIYGTKIDATINPPKKISDPFRSKVKGFVESYGSGTRISLRISFGIVNIFVLLIWYIPMLSLLQHKKNQDLISILSIFGLCSIFSLLCLLLLWLKLNWDKSRLENWLKKNL